MIGANVPKHLVAGAQTGFLAATEGRDYPWQQITQVHNMDQKTVDLVDLGAAPMPTESKGGATIQDFIEKTIQVTVKDWDITVWVSYNAVKDDQTGNLESKVRGAGARFQAHLNKEAFTALNGGDGTTYGLCYDGQEFFDSDHSDKGAAYQTDQDNEYDLSLTLDNFDTVHNAAKLFRDDQGEYTDYEYDLLVAHPNNRIAAFNITGNPQSYDTGNREENPYAGSMKAPILTPYFDTTAWVLVSSSGDTKPIILALKEQPHLQHAWFDPTAADGGRYYFKFYARYRFYYGDWRRAVMGDS